MIIKRKITIKVPGKIILSGEYSVLYKNPAIILPLNKYLHCTISENEIKGTTIHLSNLKVKYKFSSKDINDKIEDIKMKLSSKGSEINNYELIIYILYLLKRAYNLDLNKILILINSEIPINYGLGSSASFIVALLKSIQAYYNLDITENQFLKLATKIEDVLHGKSSGIDIKAVFFNKPLFYDINKKLEILKKINLKFFIVYTGNPDNSSKKCIEHVINLKKPQSFWNQFANITYDLKNNIINNEYEKIIELIKKNHKLLCKIGVVPDEVNTFIKNIEELGGAGKICGSGNIGPNNGGAIIVFLKNVKQISELCKKYNYNFFKIRFK